MTKADNSFTAVKEGLGDLKIRYNGSLDVKEAFHIYELTQLNSGLKIHLVDKYLALEEDLEEKKKNNSNNTNLPILANKTPKQKMKIFVQSEHEIYSKGRCFVDIWDENGELIDTFPIKEEIWLFPAIGINNGLLIECDLDLECNIPYELGFKNLKFYNADTKEFIDYDTPIPLTVIAPSDNLEFQINI